jgi:hypothetical protein
MATVADIGVNVWAQSAQFTSEMEKVRAQGKSTFSGLAGDVESWSHKMHQSLGVLREFRSITELGFGIGIGREAFEKLHEGLTKAAEGFSDAREHGMSFGASLDTAVAKVFGFKSSLDNLIETEKKLHEAQALGSKADISSEAAAAAAAGTPIPHLWANLSDPSANERSLADRQAAAGSAYLAAQDQLSIRTDYQNRSQFYSQRGDQTSTDYFKSKANELSSDPLIKEYDKQKKALDDFKNYMSNLNLAEPGKKAVAGFVNTMVGGLSVGDWAKNPAFALKEGMLRIGSGLASIDETMWKPFHNAIDKGEREASKQLSEYAKTLETPLEKAQDAMHKLDSFKSHMSSSDYEYNRNKIAEDYAKTKERIAPHDAGGADEFGTEAGYKAVQDSQNALAGLQDSQTDLLEASNDIQTGMAATLTTITDRLGNGTQITNLDNLA